MDPYTPPIDHYAPDEKKEDYDDVTASLSNESNGSRDTNTGAPHISPGGTEYNLKHMDSASEYSIGSGQASMEMAQYLDDVESGGNNDICSFQDINLNESNEAGEGYSEDEIRRARKRYYLMPMLIRYSLPIAGCLLAFMMVIITIAVTASVVHKQDEKALANYPMTQGGLEGETVGAWDVQLGAQKETEFGVDSVGDDALTFHTSYDDAPVYDDAVEGDGEGEEDVGQPLEFSTEDEDEEAVDSYDDEATSRPTDDGAVGHDSVGDPFEHTPTFDDQGMEIDRTDDGNSYIEVGASDDGLVDNSEEVGTPLEFTPEYDDMTEVDRTEDGSITDDGITSGTTDDASSSNGSSITSSGAHPKWYTTSHQKYLDLLEFHSSTSTMVSPHHTAALFCNDVGQTLCSFSTYCPSGKSAEPYGGGPDNLFDMAQSEWEQWAPVNTHGQGVEWVQVGKIIDAVDEYEARCWRYDEWEEGGDMETMVSAEHRRYILCCDSQNI